MRRLDLDATDGVAVVLAGFDIVRNLNCQIVKPLLRFPARSQLCFQERRRSFYSRVAKVQLLIAEFRQQLDPLPLPLRDVPQLDHSPLTDGRTMERQA